MAETGPQGSATNAPDWSEIARKLLDLWQDHLSAVAADPDLTAQMRGCSRPIRRKVAFWRQGCRQVVPDPGRNRSGGGDGGREAMTLAQTMQAPIQGGQRWGQRCQHLMLALSLWGTPRSPGPP
jgi:hypothetical protein